MEPERTEGAIVTAEQLPERPELAEKLPAGTLDLQLKQVECAVRAGEGT